MKNFLYFIADFAIIFIGSLVFPDYIVLNNWKDAVIATLIWWGIVAICNLISLAFIGIASIKTNISTIVIALVLTISLGLASSFIGLLVATHIVEGFAINGFWTWIIVVVLSTLFSIDPNQSSSSKDKD